MRFFIPKKTIDNDIEKNDKVIILKYKLLVNTILLKPI
jgi:hypothetical protein